MRHEARDILAKEGKVSQDPRIVDVTVDLPSPTSLDVVRTLYCEHPAGVRYILEAPIKATIHGEGELITDPTGSNQTLNLSKDSEVRFKMF